MALFKRKRWPVFPGTTSAPLKGGSGGSGNNAGSSGMCNYCHQQPKRVENGRTHPYCSRTCARAAQARPAVAAQPPATTATHPRGSRNTPPLAAPVATPATPALPGAAAAAAVAGRLCKNCHQRPRPIFNGFQQHYCSKCARNFPATQTGLAQVLNTVFAMPGASLGAFPPSIAVGNSTQVPPFVPARQRPGGPPCKLCQKSSHVNPNTGTVSEYCSDAHRRQAVTSGLVEACLACNKWPRRTLPNGTSSDFCSRKCETKITSAAPVLLVLDPQGQTYQSIVDQFRNKWQHNTSSPHVIRVLKVYENQSLVKKYDDYRTRIHRARGGLPGRPFGNEMRRFHGTNRQCSLGDSQSATNFCNHSNCSVCMICKTSFQMLKFGTRHAWGRFGSGIYTSATSSKAHGYVRNQGQSPQAGATKAIIMARVVCGRVKKYQSDQPQLSAPPAGFDCVIGEPGNNLLFDELIVYDNDAIRPAYIIIYQ